MSRRWSSVVTGGGLALTLAGVAPASATTLVPASLSELVAEAHVIVWGQVVDTRPVWVEGRRAIDTVVTLAAEQYWKGDFGRTVIFRVPGGELGRYRSVVPGAPTFVPGEEVVLFLTARGPALPVLLGLAQGVVRVVREASDGRPMVATPVFVASSAGTTRLVRGDPARRRVTLEEFRALVGDRLREAGPGGRGAAGRPGGGRRRSVVP